MSPYDVLFGREKMFAKECKRCKYVEYYPNKTVLGLFAGGVD